MSHLQEIEEFQAQLSEASSNAKQVELYLQMVRNAIEDRSACTITEYSAALALHSADGIEAVEDMFSETKNAFVAYEIYDLAGKLLRPFMTAADDAERNAIWRRIDALVSKAGY